MELPFAMPLTVRATKGDWIEVCVKPVPGVSGYLHKSVVCKDPEDAKKQVLMAEAKKAFQGRRSIAGSEVDGNEFNIGMIGPDETYLRGMQEKLEQLMYFESESVLLKQRLRALFVLNMRWQRHGKYKDTPVEILLASRQYGSIPASAYRYEHEDKLRHLVRLPKVTPSFFRKAEEIVYVKAKGSGASIAGFRHVSHALFAQLLRIYFPTSIDLQLQKDEKSRQFSYTNSQPISFFSIRGGKPNKHSAKIQYGGGVALVDVSPPLKGDIELLFVAGDTQRRLEQARNSVRVKHGQRKYAKPDLSYYGTAPQAATVEFDFDQDKVIDLLVSYESCPEEAGDSSDIIHAFNVKGKWVRQLVSQSWCYP
jgi:hypothetical protein